MKKLIRITTVPVSLRGLLKGQLRFMSENGFEVIGISSPGEALEDVEKNEEIRTVGIEMTRSITPLKDLKALYQLIKLFRKEKPTIVHTHTPKAGLLGMLAARIVGVPYRLHTVAGLPLVVVSGLKRKLLNFVEKLTYACATRVYPNSYGLQEIILDNKFTTEEKLKIIGKGSSNGIDTSIFNPENVSQIEIADLKDKIGLNASEFVFLFVGRIVADKGVNELIEAFLRIKKEHSNCSLVMVGGIHTDDPISEITLNEIKNNDSIYAVGIERNVVPYYAMSDAFVFPSYREGFPNVVLESSAMSLPTIATDINGCNEIVTDKETGLIIPTQDANQLYLAMKKLYTNKELYSLIKQKSRSNVQEKFERKFVWTELLKEYQSLLKQK